MNVAPHRSGSMERPRVEGIRAPAAQGGAHADRPAALSARQGPGCGGSKARALGRRTRARPVPQIRLAVDVVYPTWLVLDCFKAFVDEQPDTRIELYETVLGGTDDDADALRLCSDAWLPRTLSVLSLRRAVSSACRLRRVRSGRRARGRPASSAVLEATGGTRSLHADA